MAAEDSFLTDLFPENNQQSPSLSTNDVVSDDLYMSPQEIEAYNQYQAMQPTQPAINAQSPYTYYPDLNHNIAVGNSSGSVIGSQTLFAPGGNLVPLGLMDARDAAVMKASLQKQKEVDDFRKQFKAPTSKLTNINDGLTDEYFGFLDSSWKRALKKAGGDPNRATYLLKNSPDFWAKEKSYQDLARRGDAVVGKIADIDSRIKKGDVMSPALIEAKNKVLMDMNPDSDGFRNLAQSIMRLDADREFSDAANEALKSVVASKTGRVLNLSNDSDYKIYKETVEQLDEEAKQAVKDNLNKIYANSSLYSPEYIDRNIDGLTKWKKVTKDLDVKAKPDSGSVYDDGNVISESGEKVVSRGKTVNSYTEHFVPTNANDQKKELKFAISKDMVSADGQPVNAGETGYVKGFVQGIGVKPFYKRENRYLTDEEVKVMKDRGTYDTTTDLEMRPAVIFNVSSPKIEKTDEEGNIISEPGEQKTVYFDTDKIAGIFKESRSSGKDYEAMRKKTESYADQLNSKRQKGSSQVPKEKTEDLRKKYNY